MNLEPFIDTGRRLFMLGIQHSDYQDMKQGHLKGWEYALYF